MNKHTTPSQTSHLSPGASIVIEQSYTSLTSRLPSHVALHIAPGDSTGTEVRVQTFAHDPSRETKLAFRQRWGAAVIRALEQHSVVSVSVNRIGIDTALPLGAGCSKSSA